MKHRSVLALPALLFGLSCDAPQQATGLKERIPAGPSEVISDGAHSGNKDFFFLPPMVPPPYQHPDFERGKFNPRLRSSLRIEVCQLASEPNDAAPTPLTLCDPTVPLIKTFAPGSIDLVGVPSEQTGWWSSFDLPVDGFYKALWDTRLHTLSLDKYYRIKVLLDGSTEPLGYADVDPVSNMREWRHALTGELVTMIDDTKLPIVFRVETGALCGEASQCGSATITNDNPNGDTQLLQVLNEAGIPVAGVLIPDGWLPPDGPQSVVFNIARVNTGTTDVAAGTQQFPCHANLPLQQFDGCFHFSTIPELPVLDETGRQFATPIIGAVCFVLADTDDPRLPWVQLWSSEPDEEGDQPIPLKSADASAILTDPEGHSCGDQEAIIADSRSNFVTRFASAGWQKFTSGMGRVFGIKTAYAVDLGLGGILDGISNIGPAMTAEIRPVSSTSLTVVPGTSVTSTVMVVGTRVHNGEPLGVPTPGGNTEGIPGIPVTFTLKDAAGADLPVTGESGSTSVTVLSGSTGLASVTWAVPPSRDTYTLTAKGKVKGGPVPFNGATPPDPVLTFTGTEVIQLTSITLVQYKLAVTNHQAFPGAMFVSAPNLEPCNGNANASRTRVDIYNASNDALVETFCLVSNPSTLQSFSFVLQQGTAPPPTAYVKFVDRATGVTYSSNTVTIVAPSLGAWNLRAPMPAPLYSHAVAVVGGTLYVLGGVGLAPTGGQVMTSEIRAYDPVLNTWSSAGNLSQPNWGHRTAVIDGVIYSVGGHSELNASTNISSVETFTPATGAQGSIANMPGPRSNAGVAAVDGILYVIGGSSANINSVSSVFAYNPATGAWSTRTAMPKPRHDFATAVVNGIIYAIGGRDFRTDTGQFGTLSEVYAYNPATDTWSGPLAPMPHPSKAMSVAVIDGLIYIAGGIGEGVGLANVDAYDPVTNVWIPKASMPAARGLTAGGFVNGAFYVLGGFLAGGPIVATNEAFSP